MYKKNEKLSVKENAPFTRRQNRILPVYGVRYKGVVVLARQPVTPQQNQILFAVDEEYICKEF